MGSRRKAREYALQALYLADISTLPPAVALACLTRDEDMEEKTLEFAKGLTEGTLENKDSLDQLIVKYTRNWELGRMAALDRNILRLGAYEIIFELTTPVSVVIDEAVEIAKMFSTGDSGKFVNGILDKIKDERKEASQTGNGKSANHQKAS